MSDIREIVVVRDFNRFPAGRYASDGKGNGSAFRDKLLVPVLEGGECAIINLDGAPGYPSSFLEEVFGGLIRKGFSLEEVQQSLDIKVTEPALKRFKQLIYSHMERAAEQARSKKDSR